MNSIVQAVDNEIRSSLESADIPPAELKSHLIQQARRLTLLVFLLPYLLGKVTDEELKMLVYAVRSQCKFDDNPEGVLGVLDAMAAMMNPGSDNG